MTDKNVMSITDYEYKLQKIQGDIQFNSDDVDRITCRTNDFNIAQRER